MQNLRAAMNGTATAASSTDDYRKLIEECQTLRSPRLDVVPVLVTDIRKAFEDARLRITPEGEALLDELTHRSLIYFRHFLKSHENAEKHFSAVKVRTYDLVSHLQRIEIRRQQGLAHDYGHFWMNQAEDCVERKPRSSDGSDSSDSGISTNESVKQDKGVSSEQDELPTEDELLKLFKKIQDALVVDASENRLVIHEVNGFVKDLEIELRYAELRHFGLIRESVKLERLEKELILRLSTIYEDMLRSRNKLNAVGLIEFIEQEIFVQIPCTVSAKLDEKKDDVSSRSAKWKAALSEPVGQAMWSMLVKTDSYGVLRGWTVDRFAEEVAAMCEVMESVDWPAEFSAMVGKGAPTIADQIMAVDAMWRGNRLKGVGTVVMKACCRLIPVQYSRYNYVWENGPLIEASRSLVLAEEEEERAFLKTLAARKRKSSQ